MAVAPGAHRLRHGHGGGGRGIARQGGHAGRIEQAVVDADLVEVAAAQEVVAALHLVGRHHARGQAELIECGVVVGGGLLAGHFLAVHVQAHAVVFVPAEGDVLPLLRRGNLVELERHARARQVGIGDERIEAVAVPVDAQPGHVPAAVVGIADPEDHERCFAHRVAGPPEEAQRAALGLDVARRVPRQHAIIRPFDRAAMRPVRHPLHLVHEVRYRIARGGVGLQALVGRDVEEQLRGGLRPGGATARKQQGQQAGRQAGGTDQGGDRAMHGTFLSTAETVQRNHQRASAAHGGLPPPYRARHPGEKDGDGRDTGGGRRSTVRTCSAGRGSTAARYACSGPAATTPNRHSAHRRCRAG